MKYFIAESIMTEPCPVTGEEMKSTYVPAHVAHLHRGIDQRPGLIAVDQPQLFLRRVVYFIIQIQFLAVHHAVSAGTMAEGLSRPNACRRA